MNGLLIDDDAVYAQVLKHSLERRGCRVQVAPNAATALALAAAEMMEFALLDLKLGTQSGLELIRPLRELQPSMRIILVTGYASIVTAVEAIKRGADNYLAKPVTSAALLRVLNAAPTAVDDAPDTMLPLRRLEWEHIQQALQDCAGNISAAARLLGTHRRSLQRKLAQRPGAELSPHET